MNAVRRNFCLFVILMLFPLGNVSCALSQIVSLPQRSTQSVVDLSQTLAAQESLITTNANAQTTLIAQDVAMSTAIAEVQTTSAAQESLLQTANQVLSTATQVASKNSTQIAGLRHLSATQYLQIEDYNNSIRCSDRPDSIEFTNNSTVSASLKSWLEDTSEKIISARWEVVWEGPETAIHLFTGQQYYYTYLVYFDEPEYYYYASIYDVYMHCFIYP
jgi:hypothetical protein